MKQFFKYTGGGIAMFMMASLLLCCSREESAIQAESYEYLNNGIDFTKEELPAEEFGRWAQTPGNGCIKAKTIGEVNFKLFHKPVDYMICSENNFKELDETAYEKKRAELNGLEYFDLRIEMKDKNGDLLKQVANGYSGYDALVKYYSFEAQRDIFLACGNDTVKCAMLHFERTYGSVPYLSFVIAFKSSPAISNSDDLTFILNDRVFDKGIIKFNYSKEELTNLPKLKL